MRIRHVAGRMLVVLLLAGLLRRYPGVSPSLRRVGELLAERLPVTLRGVGIGLACGWFMALSLAGPAALSRSPFFDRLGLERHIPLPSFRTVCPAAASGRRSLFAGDRLRDFSAS